MELEKQVCSLELAERLKELGMKQESLFWWVEMIYAKIDERGHTENTKPLWDIVNSEVAAWNDRRPRISAFTVAELGELIPPTLHLNGPYGWVSWKEGAEWKCRAHYYASADQIAATEADARAKMLIYLLEKKSTTLA
jgi:hypothetical protein